MKVSALHKRERNWNHSDIKKVKKVTGWIDIFNFT